MSGAFPLEDAPRLGYGAAMDAPNDRPPPAWIADSLQRSEAQIEAGQTVPLEPILDRLRGSIARMQAGRARKQPKTARVA